MTTSTQIGYARCSTDNQDLTAQREALINLGVDPERVYTDHGVTGQARARPGLDQALAAARKGDTFVVTKLDRLARSAPDVRQIADGLAARGVRLALGATVYDPTDPMGKMFFNIRNPGCTVLGERPASRIDRNPPDYGHGNCLGQSSPAVSRGPRGGGYQRVRSLPVLGVD